MAAIQFKTSSSGGWIKIYTIKGDDGHSPIIDISEETGNWTIDGVDTGKPAIAQVDENVQIAFTEAATRANIASGESIRTILGKIKKWFTDFGSLAWKSAVSWATEVSDKPTTIGGYGITDAYTKTEVDNKVSAIYKYKGSVANFAALPTENMTIGDVYNLLDTGVNVAYTGEVGNLWDNLGATYGLATQSANGLMSSIDKTKLDGIAVGANNYTHPSSHSADIIVDGTTNKAYTADEKTKLANIAAGAQVNNISDANATALTGGEATTLHKHSYNNLDDKPIIPDAQIQSDWNQANNTAKDFIKNKPTIPTVTNDFTNDYKGLLDRVSGFNSVTTLTSLPVTKQSIIASVTAATTISLAATLTNGLLLHIKVYNTSTSAITQTLPTTGSFESKKTDGTNKTSISIPAGGNAEISIWAINDKYIIKTDI